MTSSLRDSDSRGRIARRHVPLKWAVAGLVLLAAGCSGLIRDRVFQPRPLSETPVTWATEAPQEVTATTADGLTLHGYYWPAEAGNNTLIVSFHGNGFNQLVGAARAEPFRVGGHGVLVASYRGYGGNPGNPSEDGLMLDGAAWMEKAADLAPASKRYVFGHSLGGAVALAMAGRFQTEGVATLGTFTSMEAMVPTMVRGSLEDRFDNLTSIRSVSAPLFLYHGTDDEVVPFTSAEQLRQANPEHAIVVPLEGARHHVDMNRFATLVWSNFENR